MLTSITSSSRLRRGFFCLPSSCIRRLMRRVIEFFRRFFRRAAHEATITTCVSLVEIPLLEEQREETINFDKSKNQFSSEEQKKGGKNDPEDDYTLSGPEERELNRLRPTQEPQLSSTSNRHSQMPPTRRSMPRVRRKNKLKFKKVVENNCKHKILLFPFVFLSILWAICLSVIEIGSLTSHAKSSTLTCFILLFSALFILLLAIIALCGLYKKHTDGIFGLTSIVCVVQLFGFFISLGKSGIYELNTILSLITLFVLLFWMLAFQIIDHAKMQQCYQPLTEDSDEEGNNQSLTEDSD